MGDANECDAVKDKKLACDYAAKVAFALKLGYNEELLNSALAYLGPCPSQNELLAELVKLGDLNKTTFESEYNHFDIEAKRRPEYDLRPIVVDGSNVAMSHGNGEYFSCKGIKICVEWFRNRGHNDITVFVPKWRKEKYSKDNPIKDSEILQELERDRLLVFTPSKFIGGKRVICYDDRYILKLATETDGVVVSNDNYRDLVQEKVEFKKVVEERVLMFSFVNDLFMPPDDPLGRLGPSLDSFLRIPSQLMNESLSICPYGKKCTYGIKCKFYHPKICLGQARGGVGADKGEIQQKFNKNGMRRFTPVGKSQSLPLTTSEQQHSAKVKLCRAKSNCSEKLPLQRRPAKQLSKSNVFQEPPAGSMLEHEMSASICSKLHSNSEVDASAEMLWSSLANISLSTEREVHNHHHKLQRRSSNKSQQSVQMKSPLQ